MDNKLFLNLGCGELPIKDCVNVDIKPMKHVDKVVDLSKLPWPWPDSSFDGIYMIHSLEHFINPLEIINECHRILKPGGGFLYPSPTYIFGKRNRTNAALSYFQYRNG